MIEHIQHSCGHVQEQVVPFSQVFKHGLVEQIYAKHDWVDRLRRVPCLLCCKQEIKDAEEELARLKEKQRCAGENYANTVHL